jgi:hypothetical protein
MANELKCLCVCLKDSSKINFIAMQTARIVQAVALMLIVALAASCAASKQYTSKLFTPRDAVAKDNPKDPADKASEPVALRFLDLDQAEPDQSNWVTTDIIMGRDTSSNTAALDKFSNSFPAAPVLTPVKPVKKDSVNTINKDKEIYVTPILVNNGETRTKKSRDEKQVISGQ